MKMKRFCEFINERKIEDKHKSGTYIEASLSKADKNELYKLVSDLEIPDLIDSKKYHSTIIYSRKGIPEVEDYKFKLPYTAAFKEWKILGTDNKVLTLALTSKDLSSTHNDIMNKFDATYDFDEYIPHITIANNYNGMLPKEKIKMTFTFDKINIEGLDDE